MDNQDSCVDPALLAGNRRPATGYRARLLTQDFTRAYGAFVGKQKPKFEGN